MLPIWTTGLKVKQQKPTNHSVNVNTMSGNGDTGEAASKTVSTTPSASSAGESQDTPTSESMAKAELEGFRV